MYNQLQNILSILKYLEVRMDIVKREKNHFVCPCCDIKFRLHASDVFYHRDMRPHWLKFITGGDRSYFFVVCGDCHSVSRYRLELLSEEYQKQVKEKYGIE